jgi:hypothetical protein
MLVWNEETESFEEEGDFKTSEPSTTGLLDADLEWYNTGIVPEGMTFDSMGNMVPVGDPSAASADPSGEAQAYLNAIQSGKDVNFGAALKSFQNILNGKGSMGGMGQIAALGGIATLLNKMGGGLGQTGQGVHRGYQGGIPKYTATRQQYAVPTDGKPSTYNPSTQEIKDYISRPGITDAMVARGMNQFGITPDRIAGITGLTTDAVNQRYQAAMGPNMTARRPGSGGVTYFSPMQYTKASATPPANEQGKTWDYGVAAPPESVAAPTNPPIVPGYAAGGISNLGGYSDGGRLLRGPGDGVSDSIPATIGGRQPARLADGEFVVPARIVSELGNGSTDAGAKKLYAMMDRVQNARKKTTKNVAANTKAARFLPR